MSLRCEYCTFPATHWATQPNHPNPKIRWVTSNLCPAHAAIQEQTPGWDVKKMEIYRAPPIEKTAVNDREWMTQAADGIADKWSPGGGKDDGL